MIIKKKNAELMASGDLFAADEKNSHTHTRECYNIIQ